jgi:glycosyltransferase involved in cell wall biosynthesis
MGSHISTLGRLPAISVHREIPGAVALILPSLWPKTVPLTVLEALSSGSRPSQVISEEPVDAKLLVPDMEQTGLITC